MTVSFGIALVLSGILSFVAAALLDLKKVLRQPQITNGRCYTRPPIEPLTMTEGTRRLIFWGTVAIQILLLPFFLGAYTAMIAITMVCHLRIGVEIGNRWLAIRRRGEDRVFFVRCFLPVFYVWRRFVNFLLSVFRLGLFPEQGHVYLVSLTCKVPMNASL